MSEVVRPKTVRVMAEWCVELPLWSDDPDLVGPLEADDLGLSEALANDLAAWNADWERRAADHMDGTTPSPKEEAEWEAQGPPLVARLQAELGPDVHVYLWKPPRKTWRDIPGDIESVLVALRRWIVVRRRHGRGPLVTHEWDECGSDAQAPQSERDYS